VPGCFARAADPHGGGNGRAVREHPPLAALLFYGEVGGHAATGMVQNDADLPFRMPFVLQPRRDRVVGV
jgi:hypothetical protein